MRKKIERQQSVKEKWIVMWGIRKQVTGTGQQSRTD